MPQAQALAILSGEIPSRNRLMKELRIGAPKATAIRDKLISMSPELPVSAGAPPFDANKQATAAADPGTKPAPKKPSAWPLILLALPAFVAVWSGWVGIGELTGFGVVHPFPGLPAGLDKVSLNTAITLPIGFEAYATYAFRIWLSPVVSLRTRQFAKRSVLASLGFGALGQITYHLMVARGITSAPWQITTLVACIPVAVCGIGFGLAHLVHTDEPATVSA